MKILRTIDELRQAVGDARSTGATHVGMVPTMGALHEGHLSLVRAARVDNDLVVLSIFVNPTQFTDAADLAAYPSHERADAELAEAAGVDLIFAPNAAEMYPEGYATTVHVGGAVTAALEGAERGSTHFDGVATVVSKLLLAVMPDAAYFGQKDAQQLVVVKRMVADLRIPTRIVACPTMRESDGLAMSSRNAQLSADDRRRAAAVPRALAAVEAAVAKGETDPERLRVAAVGILREEKIEPNYVALVDPDTLELVSAVEQTVLCAIAAPVGEVRLLDNTLLDPHRTNPRSS
ncbi:MAG: pantoate--beta-alanine ligase [Leucobacter sp.]